MRAIFIVLAVLNVCLLGWGFLVSGGDSASEQRGQYAAASFTGLPSLTMLSEIEDVELIAGVEASGDGGAVVSMPSGEVESAPGGKPLCEMVGAFRTKLEAEDFIARLDAIDIRNELKEMELPSGPGYWVYLEPEESRRKALKKLRELQAKGVDSYVIPKGDLANGVSLGMFSQKRLADLRVREMTAFGLAPKLEVIERTYRELWVMLKEGENKKMSKITWSRLMENHKNLERRQNFCVLDVASEDNIL